MHPAAPASPPVALTIAGSDSGGGAGIQADLATMAAAGVFGTSAITAVTAQHTRGVERSHVLPVEEVTAQIDAVTEDFDVRAAKTGMLATAEIVEAVADRAGSVSFPLVVDPVMVAASGDRLLEPDAEAAYEELLGHARLATPNADEAEVLTGISVTDEESAVEAGRALLETGCDAALVKGGHVPGETVTDVLVTAEQATVLTHPRVDTDATHGSGCTLAAAITASLASGDDLETAVERGIDLLALAIRHHYDVGRGPGAVQHPVALRDDAARGPTASAVRSVVAALENAGATAIVPEVGMNVAGATPAAETVSDVAAVDGRIVRTLDGLEPVGDVRFGASSHVARFLLGAREHDPTLRFAANCRFDDDVEAAIESLGWSVATYDRAQEPTDREGATMGWAADRVFGSDTTPVAVIDRGAVGKEAMTKIVAADATTLEDRLLSLATRVTED